MAINMTNQLAIAEFDTRLLPAFQKSALLNGKFYQKPTMGESVRFNMLGKVIAGTKAPYQDIEPVGIPNNRPVAMPTPYYVGEYIDEFEEAITNVDLFAGYGDTLGMAMGRRHDQVALDTLHNAKHAQTYGTMGTYTLKTKDELAAEDLAEVHGMFVAKGVTVNPMDVCFIYPAHWYASIATDTPVASSDYITGRITQTGRVPNLHGMTLIPIENRDEGGIRRSNGSAQSSVASAQNNLQRAYAVHKNALGIANGSLKDGAGTSSATDWIPTKSAWLLQYKMALGAVQVNADGIIQVNSKQ